MARCRQTPARSRTSRSCALAVVVVALATCAMAACSDDSTPAGDATARDGRADGAPIDGAGGDGVRTDGTLDADRPDGSGGDGAVDGNQSDGTTDGSSAKAMSFFVSSAGLGKGGDLGGLTGADAHCKTLASAVGSTKTQWFAYLSAANIGGSPVNARDRIGTGPWYNVKGDMLAPNLATLHPTVDPISDRAGYIAVKPKDVVLYWDEKGQRVPGTHHDILTGSTSAGAWLAGATCADWTSSAASGVKAQVGHSDTPSSTQFSPSWNSAHDTISCSQSGVSSRGGNGRIYCFARD